VRGLANSKRSTAPSNGMDAKSSAGVPLSSPAAAQRCAEGAGLDSGAPAAAQSAMPSIALPATAPTADHFPPTPLHPRRLSFTLRISTSLTDVTIPSRRHSPAMLSSPRRPVRTMRIFSSAENWRRVARLTPSQPA